GAATGLGVDLGRLWPATRGSGGADRNGGRTTGGKPAVTRALGGRSVFRPSTRTTRSGFRARHVPLPVGKRVRASGRFGGIGGIDLLGGEDRFAVRRHLDRQAAALQRFGTARDDRGAEAPRAAEDLDFEAGVFGRPFDRAGQPGRGPGRERNGLENDPVFAFVFTQDRRGERAGRCPRGGGRIGG